MSVQVATHEIDGFKVVLVASESHVWGEHSILLRVDGEVYGHFTRPWGDALTEDMARELLDEYTAG
jgi:hypothetical protein